MKTYLIAAAMLVTLASPTLAFDANADFADNFQFTESSKRCESLDQVSRAICRKNLQNNYDLDKMIWSGLDLESREVAIRWAQTHPAQLDTPWVHITLMNIAEYQDHHREPHKFQP